MAEADGGDEDFPRWPRRIWALFRILERLPWPLGEDLFGRYFVVSGIVGRRRFRRALAWASAQPMTRGERHRLARALCFNNGRFTARATLMGVRRPEMLPRMSVIRGQTHLTGAKGGRLLVGFHLGPRATWLALRVAGHAVTWVGQRAFAGLWLPAVRDRYMTGHGDLFLSGPEQGSLRALHRAVTILRDGGTVIINADGGGRGVFSVPLPGAPMVIQGGWLALRRAGRATVLPVLSHMEGHTQIVTVHPALSPPDADPATDLETCRASLGALLGDYVRRFPEQCVTLALPPEARDIPETRRPADLAQ